MAAKQWKESDDVTLLTMDGRDGIGNDAIVLLFDDKHVLLEVFSMIGGPDFEWLLPIDEFFWEASSQTWLYKDDVFED